VKWRRRLCMYLVIIMFHSCGWYSCSPVSGLALESGNGICKSKMLSIKLPVQYCDKSTEQAMKEYGHAAINGVLWDLNVKKIMFGSACSPDLQRTYFNYAPFDPIRSCKPWGDVLTSFQLYINLIYGCVQHVTGEELLGLKLQ